MESSSDIISIVSLSIAIAGIVLGVANHKRIRARCCKSVLVASLDIENTSPMVSLRVPLIT